MENAEKLWTKVVAQILSVLLVITLMFAPVILVVLSMLNADTIAQVVTKTVSQEMRNTQENKKTAELVLEKLPEEVAGSQDVEKVVEDLLGDSASDEVMEEIMDSDIAEEFIALYTQDLTNSLTGKSEKPQLDEEKLKALTNENMDEILEMAEELNPELTKADLQDLESTITQVVDENAKEIIAAVPDAKTLKKDLASNVPGLQMLLNIMAMKTAVTAIAIALMVLLGAGIFVCFMKDFRGFRTLAVDLFIGGGFNALLFAGVLVVMPLLMNEISLSLIVSATEALMSVFNRGMLLWAVGLLVLGGAMMGAYFVVKKLRAKAPVHMEEA